MSLEDEGTKRMLGKLHEFCHKVENELQLSGVWDLKPLINGQELMQLLNIPPGPAIREFLERYVSFVSPIIASTHPKKMQEKK